MRTKCGSPLEGTVVQHIINLLAPARTRLSTLVIYTLGTIVILLVGFTKRRYSFTRSMLVRKSSRVSTRASASSAEVSPAGEHRAFRSNASSSPRIYWSHSGCLFAPRLPSSLPLVLVAVPGCLAVALPGRWRRRRIVYPPVTRRRCWWWWCRRGGWWWWCRRRGWRRGRRGGWARVVQQSLALSGAERLKSRSG